MAISFAEQLATFAAKTKGQVDAVTAGSLREAGQRLIDRSPVDTSRFQSNWNYSLETPDIFFGDGKRGVRVVNDIADIPTKAAGFVHFITNSAPYGPALERGHSKQAPQGMVGLTAIEWPQIVAEQALKVQR
jgi:hypothetical protein